jgi:hypothetical protein
VYRPYTYHKRLSCSDGLRKKILTAFKVPLPCVASGSCTKTPGGSRAGPAALADYTPLQAPMVPGLIIHCVNEVGHRCWNTRVKLPNFDLFGEFRFNGMIKSNSQNHKIMLFTIEVPYRPT